MESSSFKENKKDIFYLLFFFILWPFGAFLYSLTRIREQFSRLIIYLWFIVFGIGFTVGNESADSFGYVESFKETNSFILETYWSDIKEYFSFDSNIKDIFSLTVNVIVSSFTDNYHYLFFILAIVFGFFYLKSLGFLLRLPKINNKTIFYLCVFLFCFSNPIFNINGVRFWTASWISVYLMFQIFVNKSYKHIPLILITPLIHGSYFIYIALVLLMLVCKKYIKILIPVFIISGFISAVSFLDIISDYSEKLPQFLQNMLWSYTESYEALQKMSGSGDYSAPLYAKTLNYLPQILIFIIVLILIKEKSNLRNNHNNLLGVILIWMSFSNFTMSIPSVGVRYVKLIIPFVAFLWLSNYTQLKKYNIIIYLLPIAYSYKILDWYRCMISISDISTYLTPLPCIININLL